MTSLRERLREGGWLMEWYDFRRGSPWGYIRRKAASIASGFLNLIDWFPLIWRDRDFDHAFLVDITEHKLRRMSSYFKTSNIVVGSQRIARQIRVVADLLRRVEADDYLDRFPKPIQRDSILEADRLRQRDLDTACRLLAKHLLEWWD